MAALAVAFQLRLGHECFRPHRPATDAALVGTLGRRPSPPYISDAASETRAIKSTSSRLAGPPKSALAESPTARRRGRASLMRRGLGPP